MPLRRFIVKKESAVKKLSTSREEVNAVSPKIRSLEKKKNPKSEEDMPLSPITNSYRDDYSCTSRSPRTDCISYAIENETILDDRIRDAMQRSPRFLFRRRAKKRQDEALKTALSKPNLLSSASSLHQEQDQCDDRLSNEDIYCQCDALTPRLSSKLSQGSDITLTRSTNRKSKKFFAKPSPPKSPIVQKSFQHRGRKVSSF